MKPVVFRVDGGSAYGVAMGHVFRCLRLAKQLTAMGFECRFCMKPDEVSQRLVEADGFEASLLPALGSAAEEARHVCALVAGMGGLLYIDLRGSKKRLVDEARVVGLPVFVYDDVYEDGLHPDVLVNPSEADRPRYREPSVEYLLGSDYIILDPALPAFRKRSFAHRPAHLFVSFGGADPCDLSSRTVRILQDMGCRARVTVAVGPAYRSMAVLQTLSTENVVLCRDSSFLAPLMHEADAAITSGGTVMCEAMELRLPTLVFPSIAHEVAIAEHYKSVGLLASISADAAEVPDATLRLAIERFLSDADRRKQLFIAQSSKPPFAGAAAIADRIRRFVEAPVAPSTE